MSEQHHELCARDEAPQRRPRPGTEIGPPLPRSRLGVHQDDAFPVARRPLPDRDWLGRALAISDLISDREFRRRGLYAEICKPLGVRAMMKVFLPTGEATGALFVFDTARSRFTDSDRLTLQRLVPHLLQLRRNAHARGTYPALIDSTAAARTRLQRLTPRERVAFARAAAGETNTVIAQALFVSPGPSASTLNTSTTSSKSAPEQKRLRSTPKSEAVEWAQLHERHHTSRTAATTSARSTRIQSHPRTHRLTIANNPARLR